MDVKGLAAIVTGGGSGLGAETARQLAAAGAKVAVLDVNAEAAAAVAGEIGGLAPITDTATTRRAGVAGVLFLAGMLLFCGSLYLKALGQADITNPLAPAGGFLLMAGWLALAWAGLGLLRPRG